MPNNKSFKETPITSWVVTDSDGTVVQLDSNADITIPSQDFLSNMRQYSFDNPEVGIMVLSGRKDSDLYKFYKNSFVTNSGDKRTPKIVLASENGAYFRLATKPDELLSQSSPLSETIKTAITLAVSRPAGEYYTDTNKDLDLSKPSIRLEMKDFGCTCHFRIPNKKSDDFEVIKRRIRDNFLIIIKEYTDLHVDFEASSAFTLERVSKGITLQKLADRELEILFQENNLFVTIPEKMSYTGDDRGDWPSFKVLNEKLNEGILQGYTARPCNHSPNTADVSSRISNSPNQREGKEDFYLLGTSSLSAQEMHRSFIFDHKISEELNDLRRELSKFELLSSLHQEVPSLVLLTPEDVLIQEPEKYNPNILENLKHWNYSQLFVVANDEPTSCNLIKISKENRNIIVITENNLLYKNGVSKNEYSSSFRVGLENNTIISGNQNHSNEIKFLRAIQFACSKLALLKGKNNTSSEAIGTEVSISFDMLTVSSVQKSTKKKKSSLEKLNTSISPMKKEPSSYPKK